MHSKKDSTPAVQTEVSLADESVSTFFVEEEDTSSLEHQVVAEARDRVSIGQGSYRTLPRFNHD